MDENEYKKFLRYVDQLMIILSLAASGFLALTNYFKVKILG